LNWTFRRQEVSSLFETFGSDFDFSSLGTFQPEVLAPRSEKWHSKNVIEFSTILLKPIKMCPFGLEAEGNPKRKNLAHITLHTKIPDATLPRERDTIVPVIVYCKIVKLFSEDWRRAISVCTLNLVEMNVVAAADQPMCRTQLPLAHYGFRSTASKYAAVPGPSCIRPELDVAVALSV
jgi:hypothetical protein